MRPSRTRRAFTLVEMLVVIIIIGILAAILVPTIGMAIRRTKNAKIGIELNQLASAVDAYKAKYLDFPPDFSNKIVVDRHIRKAFPKISTAEKTLFDSLVWVDPTDPTQGSYVDPAEALVFWLGGFSADARRPFTGSGGPFIQIPNTNNYIVNAKRNSPIYPFDDLRLSVYTANISSGNTPDPAGVLLSNDEFELHTGNYADNDLFPVYYPPERGEPFVYFDGRTYENPQPLSSPAFPPSGSQNVVGVARPYLADAPTEKYVDQDKFQIICAGLDGEYGLPTGVFPSGTGYGVGDRDNLTSFSEGRRLEDHIP